MVATTSTRIAQTRLSEGAMALVGSVVDRTQITDPDKLLPEVCIELERRFGNGESDAAMNYHLDQMNMRTTKEIRRIIDCYFISKNLFSRREPRGKPVRSRT